MEESAPENDLAAGLVKLFTNENGIINHEACAEDLLNNRVPDDLLGILSSLSADDKKSMQEGLLKFAISRIQATGDGEFVETEAENALLLAGHLGEVPDAHRTTFIDKYMKHKESYIRQHQLNRNEEIFYAIEGLERMGMITSAKAIEMRSQYQISELKLPEADEEAEGDEEDDAM